MLKKIFLSAAFLLSGFGLIHADYPTPTESMSGLYGYANSVGQMVIKPRYDNALPFREGFAAVERGGKWGFINLRGKLICKIIYQSVKDFNYGYALVQSEGKWGAIDTSGEEVVPCMYENYGDLAEIEKVTAPDGTVTYRVAK